LVADFEEGTKKAADIAVLMAWEDGYKGGHMDFEVVEIKGTELEDTALNHVTTCLHQRSSGHKIQLLILKKIVADIQAAASYHDLKFLEPLDILDNLHSLRRSLGKTVEGKIPVC
jgi:hypothetical protein